MGNVLRLQAQDQCTVGRTVKPCLPWMGREQPPGSLQQSRGVRFPFCFHQGLVHEPEGTSERPDGGRKAQVPDRTFSEAGRCTFCLATTQLALGGRGREIGKSDGAWATQTRACTPGAATLWF